MKKTILVSSMLFALTLSATIQAQDTEKKESEEGFVFTTVKENPITSVKNQNRAGTCWCYSSYAFLESELLRLGKAQHSVPYKMFAHTSDIAFDPFLNRYAMGICNSQCTNEQIQ